MDFEEINSKLNEILLRLDHIQSLIDLDDVESPDDYDDAFDKLFGKKDNAPTLTVVRDNTNIVDFDKDA
jgi:hypothetical protein